MWAIVTISIAGVVVLCCTGIVILAASPLGKQIVAQAHATATTQAMDALKAHATSTAYTLAHPNATSTPSPTRTPLAVATPVVKPSPSSTVSASPTATAVPSSVGSMLNDATFGGTQAAFDAQYGASPDGLYQQGNLTFSINLTYGIDGKQHIFGILIYNTDASTWPLSQAETICPMFDPSDARYLGNATDSQGNFTQIYASSDLKATLPSAQFSPDPPGTFSIDYEQGKGVSGVFQCSINP